MSEKVTDEQIASVTNRVVDMMTSMGLLFTALDVSNTVKQTLQNVRHRNISPVVRSLFDSGSFGDHYVRTTINVMAGGPGGKQAQAFLYHLKSASPDDYGDDQRKQLAIPPISIDPKDDEVEVTSGDIELSPGLDGRLRIPRNYLYHAGIDTELVQVDHLDGGPNLVLSCLEEDEDPTGIAVLKYLHPSLLHVGSTLIDGFDSSKKIFAITAKTGVVHLKGTPK